jgi:hypothetical protein
VRFGALVACALLAACGGAPRSEPEADDALPAEEALVLPAYPLEADLVALPLAGPPGEFRFFVDGNSISAGKDGVVRYTLVARSAAGAHNVSYEGMRCASGELRTYALGRGGEWIPAKGGWRALGAGSAQRWHEALYREYFCRLKQPVASRAAALEALRRKPGLLTD